MTASRASLRSLDLLNFVLADVQTGVGPFLAIYLAGRGWNEERVGVALTAGGLATIAAQIPAGALIDITEAKRALVALSIAIVAGGALAIALFPGFSSVIVAQCAIGAASSSFGPAICAISLGLVGSAAFDARQGRNQAASSAGNVVAALAMGLLGYFVSERSVFSFVVVAAIPSLLALRGIKPREIDHRAARGSGDEPTESVRSLLRSRRLVIFMVCAVMFHFANAAMLPLLGEMLAKGKGRSSMMFMSACVITTQLVIAGTAGWASSIAESRGRKPILLVAFAALPIRGVLYTLTSNTVLLVGIQVLDGVCASIFGVVSVLVIADLTAGTGRFNLTLAAITTAVGVGAALSQVIAGSLVHRVDASVGFLSLAGIAAIAFVILLAGMPETLRRAT